MSAIASRRGIATLATSLLLLAGCGGGGGGTTKPPDGTGTVGTGGGTVTLPGGASVTIPAGALPADRAITVAATGTSGPGGNPIFTFGPAGTTFSPAATVTLPRPAGLAVGAAASVYWTKPGDTAHYDALPATVTAGGVTAQVTHFSLGFVGAPCTDGAACTDGLAACQAGAVSCAGGAPACVATTAQADGTSCAAATLCTAASTCQGGVCVEGAATSCDDGSPCTADACDPVAGCTHAAVTEGTTCGFTDLCTAPSACVAGTCVVGAAVSCDDGDPCTADACDPALGCTHASATNGTACGAGDACTAAPTCQAGVCVASAPVSCDDGNACTTDTCDPLQGCRHAQLGDGAVCGNGNACVPVSVCRAGACVEETATACQDLNPCTADACDPVLGCTHAPVANGVACGAADACNAAASCQAGACVAGAPSSCDDGDPCTADSCAPAVGCQHAALGNGAACGAGLVCSAGACLDQASVRDVTARFQASYLTDDGTRTTVAVAPHLGRVPVAILAPAPAPAGGRVEYPFTQVGSDWVAAAVPNGPYLLRFAYPDPVSGLTIPEYFELTTSTPTFKVTQARRPDLTFPTVPTTATVNVTGMDPWTTFSSNVMISGSQSATEVWPTRGGTLPAAGATTYSRTFNWAGAAVNVLGTPSGLADPAKGDVLYVLERLGQRLTTPHGAAYAVVVKSARLTTFPTMVDGQPFTLDAALGTHPMLTTSGAMQAGQFAAMAPAMGPGVVPSATEGLGIAIFNTPHTLQGPDMPSNVGRSGFLTLDAAAPDVDYGPLTFGLPFDALWKQWRQVIFVYQAPVLAPGATNATSFRLESDGFEPLDAGNKDAPVGPLLGPPTSPTVAGADATGDVAVPVGLEPVIAWSAPALGTADLYLVDLYELSVSGPGTVETWVMDASVQSGRSLQVPPGILRLGGTYVAVIRAIQAPWYVLDANPFGNGLPFRSTPVLTGRFSP